MGVSRTSRATKFTCLPNTHPLLPSWPARLPAALLPCHCRPGLAAAAVQGAGCAGHHPGLC